MLTVQRYEELELPSGLLGSRAVSIPLSDGLSTKANGAADALSRFPPRNSDKEDTLRHLGHLFFELNPLHQVLICRTYVLPPLLQFWRYAPEEDVQDQKIRAEMLDGWEDVKGILHHQGLSYVPEMIRAELTSGPLRHRDDSRTRCQETLWRPAVALNTCSLSEGHQLRFDSCHRRPAHEDGTLRAGADNDQCTRAGGRLHAFRAELQLLPARLLREHGIKIS